MGKNIFYLLGCLAVFTGTASADSVYEDAAKAQTERAYSENPASIDPNLKNFKSSLESYRMKTEDDGLTGLKNSEKSIDTNIYSPLAGFSDTMFSKVHANQLGKILSSPMVLYMTTMQLTEPAVAAGVNNSAMQGYESLTTRYLADQHFRNELDAHPETRQIMLRAYSECVANEIRNRGLGSQSSSGPNLEDTASWIQAQSKCMGDRTDSIGNLGGSASQFDYLGGNGKTAAGFNFKMDRSWDDQNPENEILLTDYLFNESNAKDASIGFGVDELREGFQELLGDYRFTLDQASGPGISASRELKYEYMPPGPREKWLEDKARKNYETIMDILGKMCTVDVTDQDKAGLETNAFCVKYKHDNQDQFIGLSFVGYDFDCKLLTNLYASFAYDNLQLFNAKYRNCSVFTNKIDYLKIVKDKNLALKAGHNYVVALAGEIAAGQMFLVVKNITEVIENLTSSNAYFVKHFSFQLVKNFIGNEDLQGMYMNVIGNIEKIIANINHFNNVKLYRRK